MKKIITFSLILLFTLGTISSGLFADNKELSDRLPEPWSIKLADRLPEPWSKSINVADRLPEPWSTTYKA